jgi:beta-N-acetylhexosaminidase
MKKRKAIIISILGKTLNNKEKKLIKNNKPWGIILFSRNIESFSQLTKLIESIRKVMKDNKYPILIDEEGGSVRRLSKFINNKIYSQKLFGDMFKVNNSSAITLYKIYINNICKVFKSIGININTSPVLDILKKKLIV